MDNGEWKIGARREAAQRLIALEKQSGDMKGDVHGGHVADLSLVEEPLRSEPGFG
jgi:hypothetical protein